MTMIYLSNDPLWIHAKEDDVVVYWTSNKAFLNHLKQACPENCIVLTTPTSTSKINRLTECAHFDIAIFDIDVPSTNLFDTHHLADHTFITKDEVLYYYMPKSTLFQTRTILGQKPRTYEVKSTYSEKVIEKNVPKKSIPWLAGINLRDYYLYKGAYPEQNPILDQIFDLFNPMVSFDYCPRNMVLQGKAIHVIDYDPQKISPTRPSEGVQMSRAMRKIRNYKLLAQAI